MRREQAAPRADRRRGTPPPHRAARGPAAAHQLRDGLREPADRRARRPSRATTAHGHGRARRARPAHRRARQRARHRARRDGRRTSHIACASPAASCRSSSRPPSRRSSRPPAACRARPTTSPTTPSSPPPSQRPRPSPPSTSRPRCKKSPEHLVERDRGRVAALTRSRPASRFPSPIQQTKTAAQSEKISRWRHDRARWAGGWISRETTVHENTPFVHDETSLVHDETSLVHDETSLVHDYSDDLDERSNVPFSSRGQTKRRPVLIAWTSEAMSRAHRRGRAKRCPVLISVDERSDVPCS